MVNPAPDPSQGDPLCVALPVPTDCHYLYYVVADEDGRHVFAATNEQHDINVQHARDPRAAGVISASTKLAAVIGSPVRHSLSPALHNAGFAASGLDWVYAAFEVAPGKADAALEAMRVLGISGLSVTMPHKQAVAMMVDELDPAAAALRSVNTVVSMGDGRLKGYSTDGAGFVSSLAAEGIEVAGLRVCVFGAGGAAHAIIDAVARAGAASITVINRSVNRAWAAAGLAGAIGEVGRSDAVADCDLVVNANVDRYGIRRAPVRRRSPPAEARRGRHRLPPRAARRC